LDSENRTYLKCIAIPLIAGGISGVISRSGMAAYQMLNKPPLSPPGWVFPVVWTILYALMGLASFLVLISGKPEKMVKQALTVYALQLAVNFFWPIFFFRFGWYLFSFVWLLLLWTLILLTILLFNQISGLAARFMLLYLLWVTFAGYLNFMVYLLN
jgi:tryptophan-rich sensory protein